MVSRMEFPLLSSKDINHEFRVSLEQAHDKLSKYALSVCKLSSKANVAVLAMKYWRRINFRRQKLTSMDVRFCRLKSIPALKELLN